MTNTTGTNHSTHKTIYVLGQAFRVRVLSEEEDKERERLLQEDREREKMERLKRCRLIL